MAKAGVMTTNGKCSKCQEVIAWKQVNGKYQLRDPLKNADGSFVYKQEKNAQTGRTVNRREPSETLHKCWAHVWNKSQQNAEQAERDVERAIPKVESAHGNMADTKEVLAMLRAEVIAVLNGFGIKQEIRTVIEVKLPDGKSVETDEITHPQFPTLVRFMQDGEHVYLHGDAGSGKTFGACQASRVLSRPYTVVTMPGISTGKLLGFVDAGGREVLTAFADRFVNGGTIVLDELDRSIPSVSCALNSVLENREFVINGKPIKGHKTFVAIGTGNTDMRGGTRTYTAAQPQDYALAARFAFVEWGYDEPTEERLVLGLLDTAGPFLDWLRVMRIALKEQQMDTVLCGPREAIRVVKALKSGHTLESAVNAYIWRGLPSTAQARFTKDYKLPTVIVNREAK